MTSIKCAKDKEQPKQTEEQEQQQSPYIYKGNEQPKKGEEQQQQQSYKPKDSKEN